MWLHYSPASVGLAQTRPSYSCFVLDPLKSSTLSSTFSGGVCFLHIALNFDAEWSPFS